MTKRQTLASLRAVIGLIECPGFNFVIGEKSGTRFLQLACPDGQCNETGNPLEWKGRKWILSDHMTDTELVWTAFKALTTALEHEARERFLYRGVAIADSHTDINAMVDMVRKAGTDERS